MSALRNYEWLILIKCVEQTDSDRGEQPPAARDNDQMAYKRCDQTSQYPASQVTLIQ